MVQLPNALVPAVSQWSRHLCCRSAPLSPSIPCTIIGLLLSDLENTVLANLVRAKISALGTYVPPRLLTNADLEKMVETSDQWIIERTGIRQRHIVDKGMATSDLAIEAANEALKQRGMTAKEIEAIFVGTVTPDMLFPATACI